MHLMRRASQLPPISAEIINIMDHYMNVSELTLEQLDYWVAKARKLQLIPAEGETGFNYIAHHSLPPRRWAPTKLWSQGGPIIEEAKIDLNCDWEKTGEWSASMEPDINAQGSTALEAAMRTYVTASFGENIKTR